MLVNSKLENTSDLEIRGFYNLESYIFLRWLSFAKGVTKIHCGRLLESTDIYTTDM